jgi:hypothetical protein
MKEVAFILVGIFFGVMFSLIFISTKQTSDDMKIKSYREYLRGYSEGLDYAVDVLSKDDSLQIKSSKKFGKIMVNKATKDVFLISGEDTFITSRFPDGNVGCGQKHTDHLYKTKK